MSVRKNDETHITTIAIFKSLVKYKQIDLEENNTSNFITQQIIIGRETHKIYRTFFKKFTLHARIQFFF